MYLTNVHAVWRIMLDDSMHYRKTLLFMLLRRQKRNPFKMQQGSFAH